MLEGWTAIYLEAQRLGITRLGGHGRHYSFEGWIAALDRGTKSGRTFPFWWRRGGRTAQPMTTVWHLAAWAISGGARGLRRRKRATLSAPVEGPCQAAEPAGTTREEGRPPDR